MVETKRSPEDPGHRLEILVTDFDTGDEFDLAVETKRSPGDPGHRLEILVTDLDAGDPGIIKVSQSEFDQAVETEMMELDRKRRGSKAHFTRDERKNVFGGWLFLNFHWIFMFTFPSVAGKWSTCSGGFKMWTYYIFGVYLIIIQCFEIWIWWDCKPFWDWMYSRGKFISKHLCRLPFFIPVAMDIVTSFFSRADLFTDIGFVWVAYNCKHIVGEEIYIASVVGLVIGVGCCQCCPPCCWVNCRWHTFNSYEMEYGGPDKHDREIAYIAISSMRGSDMSLSIKFLGALGDRLTPDGMVGSQPKTVDAIMSFCRLIFEDIYQTILQILFLQASGKSLSDPTNRFVVSSIFIAIVLSFIRVVFLCVEVMSSEQTSITLG